MLLFLNAAFIRTYTKTIDTDGAVLNAVIGLTLDENTILVFSSKA